MNGLVLNSEGLIGVLERDRQMSRDEIVRVCHDARGKEGRSELFGAAEELRRRHKTDVVTFSKKAFLNIVNLCKDTCSYCTYKAEPGETEKVSLMSKRQIGDTLRLAKRYRCVEALFVAGERPEHRYQEAREWLRQNGFRSTAEYLAHASEMALEAGLFPHTNAGNLEYEELKDLRGTNMSMGLMLESSSGRLAGRGMPHHMAASKRPEARMRVLEDAGRLGIPMTTGILIGIGETAEEIVDSLVAIRGLHERYGNIQEVIIQNFQPKRDTAMGGTPPADGDLFRTAVALARITMPRMNIQIPPNLSPGSYQDFLRLGINDWGGISPLTPDYVNPEFPWPEIGRVEAHSSAAGFRLRCRFPAYPEFVPRIGRRLRGMMDAIRDAEGLVREEYWR